MRHLLILILPFVICLNCATDKKDSSNYMITSVGQNQLAPIDTLLNQPRSIDDYVNTIALKNEVHSAHVGIAGSKSDTYSAYEGLIQVSTTNELFPLLQHDSTAVRVYAYKAIILKDSTLQKKAWDAMKGKNDRVKTFSGCIKFEEPISSVIQF
ncbi:hypothetical protein N9355_09945 [Crocinitomicaceae bacterium]|nr:hypothetical protein [Crocinitomicaceae bacterium]